MLFSPAKSASNSLQLSQIAHLKLGELQSHVSCYTERVFEISALQALRKRLKDAPLEGTGFPEFIAAF
jgi:hypothetical protein